MAFVTAGALYMYAKDSIAGYPTSGSFESATLDLGAANYSLDTISYNATVPGAANGVGMEIPATTAGLVGLWHMNESSASNGSTISAAVGTNGTLTTDNGATNKIVAGKLNNALSFDGTGDYVSVADSASNSPTAAITLEAWINPTSLPQWARVISKAPYPSIQYNYMLLADDTLKMVALLNTSGGGERGCTPTVAITLGAWYHVVVTYSGTVINLYVNGSNSGMGCSATFGTNAAIFDNAGNLSIGRDEGGGAYWDGKIDEVAIYNRALTADEVKAHYASFRVQMAAKTADSFAATDYVGPDGTANTYFTQPVGLWHLNEGTGSSMLDASGNGNTGTLQPGDASGTNDTTTDMWNNGTGANAKLPASPSTPQAINFDGTNDYVDIPDAAGLRPGNGSWSVSLWANPANSNQSRVLLSKRQNILPVEQFTLLIAGDAWNWAAAGQNLIGDYIEDGGNIQRLAVSTADVADGNWHHYVMVADKAADKVRLYMDGVELATTLTTNGVWPTVNNTDPLRIGDANDPGYSFNKSIDEVAVYNRALSDAEIKALYNNAAGREGAVWTLSGLPSEIPAEVGLWHLNDGGTSQSVADISGNGNAGTLGVNSSVNTDDPAWITSGCKLPNTSGPCLSFDGGDAVQIPDSNNSLDVSSQMTVSAWVYKLSNTSSGLGIIAGRQAGSGANELWNLYYGNSADDEYGFVIEPPGDGATVYIALGGASTGDLNTWVHLVGTYDGAQANLYKNGALVASVPASGNIIAETSPVCIGGAANGAARNCTGEFINARIDEVAIYNRALTPGQVKALYDYGNVGSELPLSYNPEYLRYKASFGTSDTAYTPQLDDITLDYSGYPASATLTSSKFDMGAGNYFVKGLTWTEALNAQDVKLQLSAAAASGGLGTFCGPRDGTTGTCTTTAYFTDPAGSELTDDTQVPGQWFQYKATLTSTGSGTATLDGINVIYDTVNIKITGTGNPTVGTAYPLTITAVDSLDAAVTGYDGSKTVNFTGAGTVGANAPKISDDNICGDADDAAFASAILNFASGVADPPGAETNYYLCAYKAESAISLSVTGTVPTSATTDLDIAVVNFGTASQIAFTTSPASTGTVDAAFTTQPVIAIQDQFGNTVTSDNASQVTLSSIRSDNSTPADDPLLGTLTMTAVNGIVTFTDIGYSDTDTIHVKAVISSPFAQTIYSTANITLTAGAATTIALHPTASGDGQTGAIGQALANPFKVEITDQYGNAKSGVSVTFAVGTFPSGATGQSISTTSTTTDANGEASTVLTLGNKTGGYTVTATSTGLAGSPLTFNATATAGAAVKLLITSDEPGGKTVGAGATPTTAAHIKAYDQYDNTATGDTSRVFLSSTSGTMYFYNSQANADADTQGAAGGPNGGAEATTYVTLASGEKDFWFKDTAIGTHTITATTDVVQTSNTGTGDTPNAGGFSAGTVTNTAVSGTGALAKVALLYTFVCGDPITVNHTTANGVAPEDKTVTYGTVSTTLGGTGSKCWITQNLGATTNAASATESTEPNAGWYWQFNRKAGWQYAASLYRLTTPTAWDSSNDGTYTGWDPGKDPCTIELGAGWRLPTSAEWTNADSTGAWANYNDTYASVLKLHAAGYLVNSNGGLFTRGSYGYYWSSTQSSSANGYYLTFDSSNSNTTNSNKAFGFSVRCLKD